MGWREADEVEVVKEKAEENGKKERRGVRGRKKYY